VGKRRMVIADTNGVNHAVHEAPRPAPSGITAGITVCGVWWLWGTMRQRDGGRTWFHMFATHAGPAPVTCITCATLA